MAGTRSGTSGTKLGKVPLTWAFAEAAVFCRRENPAGPPGLGRAETKHGPGTAVTIVAYQGARAVYDRVTRTPALNPPRCFNAERSGGEALDASLDHQRMPLLLHALSAIQAGGDAR